MTDKEKTIKELKEALDNLDITNKYRLNLIRAIEYLQEEPVSEELEEAALLYYPKMSRISEPHGIIPADNKSHYLGDANEDNRKAFKVGANWQKEQMMAKAVDGVVTFDYYDSGDKTYGCIAHDSFCLEDFGLKDTDKVKMILIKED